ncbi:MAG: sulfurtransferase [Candidatus Scalindua sp. AMX11]|nr:MAG: sulfurtransferase [Candidatus Scalindua sp.]NOG83472.1 sulfurtransferase [Planctomycetota bacterium]RZV72912.1 MAG: sulfurtransferase [Candidatus Scalindua sp. SCAELEC01]TDE64791.1 MAG: sulfurtransferase [Candidatus Scalindua sp. AMX11]GJQ59827.1 MAG: sulfurtransferase [Candidatus Scalindua sp.]
MKRHAERFLNIVDDAKSRINEITIDEVKAKVERGDTFSLVDVREESEWKKGHIPNAIYIGKGVIERDIEKIITNTESKIILYCGGGFRSALAADSLQKMGYLDVSSMDGGYGGWVKAGYPVKEG